MVIHLSYTEESYRTAEACLAGIRSHMTHGWGVSQLRGPLQGPFFVVFRMEERAPGIGPGAS